MVNTSKMFTEAAEQRAAVISMLEKKQDFILKLLDINGYMPIPTEDENEKTLRIYDTLPVYEQNVFYAETCHGSNVFEFRYFLQGELPETSLKDLPEKFFWKAVEAISQIILALREQLLETETRRGCSIMKLDDALFIHQRTY